MKVITRNDRELVVQLEDDESVDFVLRNRRTGERAVVRTWFMPTLLNLKALKVWHELEEVVGGG